MSKEILEVVAGEPIYRSNVGPWPPLPERTQSQPYYKGVEITSRFTREVVLETTVLLPAKGENFEWKPATKTVNTHKYLTDVEGSKLYAYINGVYNGYTKADMDNRYWCFESSSVEDVPDDKAPARMHAVEVVLKSERELTRSQVDEIRKGIFEGYVAETKRQAAEYATQVTAQNEEDTRKQTDKAFNTWYRLTKGFWK